MMTPRFLMHCSVISAFFSFQLMANDESKASLSDRLYDVEAQLAALKSELDATKSLAAQERPSAFNPSISVVGDLVGQYGFNVVNESHDHNHEHEHEDHGHGSEFKNGAMVREIELELRADVDPFADGLVVIALHSHKPGDVGIGLEEAYMRLKKWPGLGFAPLGMIIKAGIFKTAIGRMNRIHLHNLPQVNYPMAMREFLGDEGYSSQGLSMNFAFNPSETGALNLFLEGIFHSRVPMQEKGAEKMPSGIAHAWWHQELKPTHFLDLGFSGLFGRKGEKGSGLFCLLSSDLHYSYIPTGYGENPIFLFGNEFYTANKNEGHGRWPLGNFTWAQVQLIGSSFFGLRYDLAPKESDLLDFEHALGGYLTYYTTEFLRFRLGYEHVMPAINSIAGDHRLMLSMIFILGSHPVEPYFVNR